MADCVRTVTGDIEPEAMGPTLVHEHALFGYPGHEGDTTLAPFERRAFLEACRGHCLSARARGVRTLVDATPNDCGRRPDFLRELAEKTEMHIVCTTGYYHEAEGASRYFTFRRMLGCDVEEEIYQMMMHEVTVGIGRTGVRAGAVKLASGKDGISDYEMPFFRAGARVHRETGVPILTHTQEGRMGPEQARLLVSLGADPLQVQIGHMDGSTDAAYHRATLAHGVAVGFDRCGIQVLAGMPSEKERLRLLADLIHAGHGDRITLSHDFVMQFLGRPVVFPDRLRKAMPHWHTAGIFEHHLPALRSLGVSEARIDALLVDNPRRLFRGRQGTGTPSQGSAGPYSP